MLRRCLFQHSSVSSRILEGGQIAEWVIEQMEHSILSKLEGRCEAASYDMSGNCWRQFESVSKKVKASTLAKMLENEHLFVHLDDAGLDDFDALVVAKLIAQRNVSTQLLDLNNNPLIGDIGLGHLASNRVLNLNLRSLFASGCGITDEGVSQLIFPLKRADQKLRILELRKNQVSDDGAQMLSEALKYPNSSLEFSLFLNDCPNIGETGAVALAKAVIESQGKLKVWLKGACPDMSLEDKAEIAKFTKNRIRF